MGVQTMPRACVYMEITENPQEKHNMAGVRMEFWNKIHFKDIIEKHSILDDNDEDADYDLEEDDTEADVDIEEIEDSEVSPISSKCFKKLRKVRKQSKLRVRKKMARRQRLKQ